MGVGVKYTGIDGRTVSFSSHSSSSAIDTLSRIPGYLATDADKVAAGLAGGWRERHREAAARRMGGESVYGLRSNTLYSSREGIAGGVPTISGISVRDGKIRTVEQQRFIGPSGSVVGIGPKRENTIGIPSSMKERESKRMTNNLDESRYYNSESDEKIKVLDSRISKAIQDIDSVSREVEKKEQTDIVTGVDFQMGEDGLEITVKKQRATIFSADPAKMEKVKLGEKISVHENLNSEEHSEVIVLGKRKISESQAKLEAMKG